MARDHRGGYTPDSNGAFETASVPLAGALTYAVTALRLRFLYEPHDRRVHPFDFAAFDVTRTAFARKIVTLGVSA